MRRGKTTIWLNWRSNWQGRAKWEFWLEVASRAKAKGVKRRDLKAITNICHDVARRDE